jgi:3-dehydroquinate synthase
VAIDLSSAKNLVGAFYQPRLVVSDTALLRSLPPRQIRSGMAEIIKYGIIQDRKLFFFLEDNIEKIIGLNKYCLEYIIYRSSVIKARIVQRDEYDKKGIRARLNYGHTIGHAIEAASGYSKLYSHGEAVALGMIAAARIAERLGMLEGGAIERMTNLIKNAGLPTRISKKLTLKNIMKAQRYDKKIIHGTNRFILPAGIGRVKIVENIPLRLISDVIETMR